MIPAYIKLKRMRVVCIQRFSSLKTVTNDVPFIVHISVSRVSKDEEFGFSCLNMVETFFS